MLALVLASTTMRACFDEAPGFLSPTHGGRSLPPNHA